jgi:predicted nucleic acid-binding protein
MIVFVDSNVFMRLFVDDDNTSQIEQVEKLFYRARNGEIDLVTGPPVFFEISWVLASRYKVGNAKTLDILEAILSFPGLRVIDKALVINAVDLARLKNSSFADSYIAVSGQSVGAESIATFNKKHFSKMDIPLYPFE